MKRVLILATLLALLISIAAFRAATADDAYTITKIQNDQITFKDSKGQLKTLSAGSPGLKVGDKVKVVGTTVCGWDWGNRPAQQVKPPAIQKTLPFDDGSKTR